jgi:hypothetical protein
LVPGFVSDLAEGGIANNNPLVIDRFDRQDEFVDGSVFNFDAWREAGASGDGYWVFQQQGLSSVILPEDRPVAGSDNEGLPFQVFELKRLTDWESGVLTFDPATGLTLNPRPGTNDPDLPAAPGANDPFGFGAPSGPTDDEEERRRAQPNAPANAPAPSSDDPFAQPPAGSAPAMGAPSDDPFAQPAPGSAPMTGADDPFMTPPPGSPATPSN